MNQFRKSDPMFAEIFKTNNRLFPFIPHLQRRKMLSVSTVAIVIGLLFCCVDVFGSAKESKKKEPFPLSLQYFEIPEGKVFDPKSVDELIRSGATNIWIRDCKSPESQKIVDYFQKVGFKIDFMTHGNELFKRDEFPKTGVYDPNYEAEVKKQVEGGLAQIKNLDKLDYVYPYIDEPFRQKAFLDFSDNTKAEFKRRFGYEMPSSFEEALKVPRIQLDFLNFQSDIFKEGWQKTQKAVKAFDPRVKIAMTHDSHNTFGAGVNSNSQMAIDDVYHWGGAYADLFVYDIYPYLTFDYRYGEPGVYRKPRISQMHYTMAQLRNMTTAHGKTMGFWVGTYNEAWFVRFRGKERAGQFWSEREISYTAVAGGSDYIISPSNYMGYNLPVDKNHWDEYAKGLNLLQKAGGDLVKAPKVKANACFLFPRTQYLLLQEEYFNVGMSYELFLRAFGELDILHEEQVTDDKLNGYKVLVLCDVKLLPDKVAQYIKKFVENGGVVIADCLPQTNQDLKPLNTLAPIFGVSSSETGRVKREGQWVPFVNLAAKFSFPPASGETDSPYVFDVLKGSFLKNEIEVKVVSPRKIELSDGVVNLKMATGKPALVSRKFGAGSAVLLGFCLQDTYYHACKTEDARSLQGLYGLVHNLFADLKIDAHVYSSNPDIEAGLRSNNKEAYVVVINHESTDAKTEITLKQLPAIPKQIIDLEGDKTIDFNSLAGSTSFKLQVPWGKTKLLKVIYR